MNIPIVPLLGFCLSNKFENDNKLDKEFSKMTSTFSSAERTDSYKKEKKHEISPIKLPTVRIESEIVCSKPRVRVRTKPARNSLKNLKTSKERKAVKLHDLTDSVFRDLPKSLLRDIIISPKLTNKIFAAIDSGLFSESRSDMRKRSARRTNCLSNSKKSPFENIFKDLDNYYEYTQEYRKKKNASVMVRPVSPWLYQGKSRHYSIFAG